MAAIKLSKLLHDRSADTDRLIEKGQIYFYSRPVNEKTHYYVPDPTHVDDAVVAANDCFCWSAPGNGTAIIEIWGEGGSTPYTCDCAFSLPGNAGAYAKKTIPVQQGISYITGVIGCSTFADNPGVIWDRSCATTICYKVDGTYSNLVSGCMCAEGGASGYRVCSNGTNMYCCYTAADFYHTHWINNDATECTGCGIICNKHCTPGSHGDEALAFGGDVNMPGPISWAKIWGSACNTQRCCTEPWTPYPYGLFHSGQTYSSDPDAQLGATYAMAKIVDGPGGMPHPGDQSIYAVMNATNWARRRPTALHPFNCHVGRSICACHAHIRCISLVPIGTGAPAGYGCAGVADCGHRGGMGAVKITFLSATNTLNTF